MITLQKIKYFLIKASIVVALITPVSVALALAPTKNLSVLGAIEPLVHSGAGAQSIIGPLLIGSFFQIVPNQYSLQVVSQRNEQGALINQPRPAIFNKSLAPTITNSFFTVLQNSLFGRKVFVGFGKETFLTNGIEVSPSTTEWTQIKSSLPALPITPERLTVRGNILATNLNGSNGNVTGQNNICVNANGTLVLCETKNPVVDIRFDECSYNGTAGEVKDSRNAVTGTRSNAGILQTTSLGRVGRSLAFTGAANAYIISNNTSTNTYTDIRPGEELSLSMWFRSSANPADGENWIAWKEGSCLGWYIRTSTSGAINSNLRIGTGCSSYTTWQITSPTGVIDDGLWHHVVFVIDRVNHVMAQYVDGKRTGTVVLPASGNSSGGELRFGTTWNSTGIFRDGSVDEFKAFDTVLTDVDVRELFLTEKTLTRSISCS